MEPEPPDEGGPPADPDDWTDEQWLAWLQSTDGPEGGGGSTGHRRRRRGARAAGALGNAMVGLHNAIYGTIEDEVAIVVDAAGDPPDEDQPQVYLDPDHPERSEVIVRPRPQVPSDRDGD